MRVLGCVLVLTLMLLSSASALDISCTKSRSGKFLSLMNRM